MLEIDGVKLSLAMANEGVSAKEIAERSGVSQTTIARFKAGTQKARPKTLGKIAKALGIRAEEIIKM